MSNIIAIRSLLMTSSSLLDQEIADMQAAGAPETTMKRLITLRNIVQGLPNALVETDDDKAFKGMMFGFNQLRDGMRGKSRIVILDPDDITEIDLDAADELVKAKKKKK